MWLKYASLLGLRALSPNQTMKGMAQSIFLPGLALLIMIVLASCNFGPVRRSRRLRDMNYDIWAHSLSCLDVDNLPDYVYTFSYNPCGYLYLFENLHVSKCTLFCIWHSLLHLVLPCVCSLLRLHYNISKHTHTCVDLRQVIIYL